MMNPRPLLEEDATEIEKVLLLAGRSDGPRKGAASRLLAAIEASPPAPSAPAAPRTSVGPAAPIKWAKLALVAIGVGGAAAAIYHLTRPHGGAPLSVPPRPVVPAAAPVAAPSKAPEDHGGLATAREKEPDLVAEKGSARVRKASSPGRARDVSTSPLDRSLGEETRALDRAREGLDAHRPSEALRLLDDYHRRFPRGRLRPEAMVLRLTALVQAGRHDAADSLASQLLANPAYKAYVPRIRSLLGRAKQ